MSTYKAAVCVQLGNALEIQERTVPSEIGDNEIQISTYASVVNFADIERCRGQRDERPEVPFVPGAVASGLILKVGSGVKNFQAGDRVVTLNYGHLGGMAEQIVVDAKTVFKVPDNISLSKAAASVVAYCAAIAALENKARVQKGDTVLVTGAAGATGLAIADAAKNMYGCKVLPVCRGEKKQEFLRERGFEHIIQTSESDMVEAVLEMTSGEGVNVAVDVVGGQTQLDCLKSLQFDGKLVIVGFSSGEAPELPSMLIKERSITVTGLNWKTTDRVSQILKVASDGDINPYICQEFDLDQINEAYQLVWERKSIGKVVVRMQKEEA